MTQQLVLDPLGLVTEPNKLGQVPAGALTQTTNCVMRSPGVIENPKGLQQIGPAMNTSEPPYVICLPNKWVIAIYYSSSVPRWYYSWIDTTLNTVVFSDLLMWEYDFSTIRRTSQPRFTHLVYGSQLFLQCYSQTLVWDYLDPTTTPQSRPRHAGIQEPVIGQPGSAGSNGGVMAPQTRALYTAIVKRKLPGGDRYAVSAPCAAQVSVNAFDATPINIEVPISIFNMQLYGRVGDVVEVYRTKTKPTNLTSTYNAAQPGEELGGEFLKCGSLTITQQMLDFSVTEIFTDSCADTALGEALYTNQGVGEAADPPPVCEFIAAYKGFIFGFGPTYTPRIKLRTVGFWGALNATLAQVQARTALGEFTVAGCSWTAGNVTVTPANVNEAAKVFAGMRVELFNPAIPTTYVFDVATVGPTSFTVSSAPNFSRTNASVKVYDRLDVEYPAGDTNITAANNWPTFAGLSNRYRSVQTLALKLPPIGQTLGESDHLAPVDGFALKGRFLYDARSAMKIKGSKALAWDPQVNWATSLDVAPESLPQAVCWSNLSEPEAWPVLNQDFFSRGVPHGVAVTSDAIIAAYSDGIWRITGTGGTVQEGFDWRYDQIASGITVRGTQCMTTLLDRVYALTSEGLVVIDGDQVQRISYGRIHDQLDVPGFKDVAHTTSSAVFICADEENNEIVFRTPETGAAVWVYNTNTDRFTQVSTHDDPVYAAYSPYLRSVVLVGRTLGNWTLLARTSTNRSDMSATFARVYADNPFAQRHWQTLNVSVELSGAGGPVTIVPSFNGLAGSSRVVDASGRVSFEVPRNAPAVGNTMAIGLTITANGRSVKLHGFALDYRDLTERHKNR